MTHSFKVDDRVTRNNSFPTMGTVTETTSNSVTICWDGLKNWYSHLGPGCDIDSELVHIGPIEELAQCQRRSK